MPFLLAYVLHVDDNAAYIVVFYVHSVIVVML
jgi:hypothetical protein